MIVFVLQNAWRRGLAPGTTWDGASWEWALWRSHTGRRLREYIPEGAAFAVLNSTPLATNNGREVLPPDRAYVAARLAELRPALVVYLGESAQRLASHLPYPHLCAPHPCWRLLSKQRTAQVRAQIEAAV